MKAFVLFLCFAFCLAGCDKLTKSITPKSKADIAAEKAAAKEAARQNVENDWRDRKTLLGNLQPGATVADVVDKLGAPTFTSAMKTEIFGEHYRALDGLGGHTWENTDEVGARIVTFIERTGVWSDASAEAKSNAAKFETVTFAQFPIGKNAAKFWLMRESKKEKPQKAEPYDLALLYLAVPANGPSSNHDDEANAQGQKYFVLTFKEDHAAGEPLLINAFTIERQ